jgi:hypothetical protein
MPILFVRLLMMDYCQRFNSFGYFRCPDKQLFNNELDRLVMKLIKKVETNRTQCNNTIDSLFAEYANYSGEFSEDWDIFMTIWCYNYTEALKKHLEDPSQLKTYHIDENDQNWFVSLPNLLSFYKSHGIFVRDYVDCPDDMKSTLLDIKYLLSQYKASLQTGNTSDAPLLLLHGLEREHFMQVYTVSYYNSVILH